MLGGQPVADMVSSNHSPTLELWIRRVLVRAQEGQLGTYVRPSGYPADLIGLPRIPATLPRLVSHKFEGALLPVELANGIASISSYPSATILRRFTEDASTH